MMVNFHWRSRRSATRRVSNETVFELGVNFLFIYNKQNTTIKHIYWHYLFLWKPSVKSESEIYLGYFPYIFCHVCKYSHITVAPSHMQGAEWGSRKGSYDVWPTLQLSLGSNLIRLLHHAEVIDFEVSLLSKVACTHLSSLRGSTHAQTHTRTERLEEEGLTVGVWGVAQQDGPMQFVETVQSFQTGHYGLLSR